MPPAGTPGAGAAVKPDPKPTDNPPPDETAKTDSATVKAEPAAPGLYVIVAETREGQRLVELHDEISAESRYAELTYANRQQRRRHADEDDDFTLAEGGGSYEIDEKSIAVYKLGATPHKF